MSRDPGELTVRDARPEEHAAVRDLTLRAYSQYADVMEPTAWAGLAGAVRSGLASRDDQVQRMVAILDGRVVGSVMLYPPAVNAYGGEVEGAPWPELRLLAVSPEARGRGVGERLVEECIRRAREMGADALGLHSSRSMEAAIRMYRRLGFERAPEFDFHPEGAELVEAYRLPLRGEHGR
jgi:ribosomal protein S18 acetylase RimI-like enzyme